MGKGEGCLWKRWRRNMARQKKRTRRIGRRRDNDKGRDRRKEGRRRRWTAQKKRYGYGGGLRQGRETIPKARGASRPGDEHELNDRRGRLERAGATASWELGATKRES